MTQQRQMALMGEARRIQLVRPDILPMIPTAHAALMQQMQLSGMTPTRLYNLLGIDKGHGSRITSGSNYFPTTKLVRCQQLCGNMLFAQWLVAQEGYVCTKGAPQDQRSWLLETA